MPKTRNRFSKAFAVFLFFSLCLTTWSLQTAMVHSARAADIKLVDASASPTARKELVKFTGKKLVPDSLFIAKRSCSVFLVNTAENESVTVELEYGDKRMHCHSSNLKLDDDGVFRSTKPIAPRDFAILCFPEEGEYSYTVKSVQTAKVFNGSIEVKANQ